MLALPLKAISRRHHRSYERLALAQPSRRLAITCRGKPINREDLFKYTNGRFLANEKQACDRRYAMFDVDRLCEIAASTGGQNYSPVRAIEKMEGGFSKALLLCKEDGSEIVAKIPFPIAGPPKYTTASEVAVLQYLRAHTQAPVPEVLAWSCDASNPVGAEYIMMEKAPGIQLFERWDKISERDKLGIVKQLAKLEGEMTGIRFPASGSLYLRESMSEEDGDVYIALDHDADSSGRFCIGPSCERGWYSLDKDAASLHPQTNRGPWPSLSSFGIALVEREMTLLEQSPGTIKPDPPRGSHEEQLAALRMTKDVMAMMDDKSLLFAKVSEPVLWHTDLHMGNIYVSHDDPVKIVSLIDWQSIVVSPLFLQARFPEFLPVDETYILGTQDFPQLPPHFAAMDAADREYAAYKHSEAKLAKAYELSTGSANTLAYKAFWLPSFLRELFTRSGEVSEEGAIPLQACLIELSNAWHDLRFPAACPLRFSADELQRHEQQLEAYRTFHGVHEIARKALCTDAEGWIAPQRDFAALQRRNWELMEGLMGRSEEFGMQPGDVKRIWPFRERS